MQHRRGPRQPISINYNGELDYTFNPMEDLPVEEPAPWGDSRISYTNIAADYISEPVFSQEALYGIAQENSNLVSP